MSDIYTLALPESTLAIVAEAFDDVPMPEYIGAAAHDVALDDAMDALVSRIAGDYKRTCNAETPCARVMARDTRTDRHISHRKSGAHNVVTVNGQDGHTSMDASEQRAVIARRIAAGVARAESDALSFYNRTERYKK